MCEVAQKIPSEKNSPGKGDEQEIYILFRVIVTPPEKRGRKEASEGAHFRHDRVPMVH